MAIISAPIDDIKSNRAKNPLLIFDSFFIRGKKRDVILAIPKGITMAANQEKEYINLKSPISDEEIRFG